MIDVVEILSSDKLPSIPATALQLVDLCANPETEVTDFVDVVKSDPASAVRILKAANSSLFGLTTPVTSIERAVPALGMTSVASLTLSFSLAKSAMDGGPMRDQYLQYWKQSVIQAMAAERLCELACIGTPSDYFLMGLLLDIGRLALLKTIPREYQRVLTLTEESEDELHVVERNQLETNHTEIGAKLSTIWNLPTHFTQAIQLHHSRPSTLPEGDVDDPKLVQAGTVVGIVGEYYFSPNRGFHLKHLTNVAADLYDLSESDVHQYLTAVGDRFENSADIFSLSADAVPSCGELLRMANQQLVQLADRILCGLSSD